MTKQDSDQDVIIIGGGVVGLSCAYDLAREGLRVALLERHARVGQETSTHNSGVIHAGIYYQPGSLKAKLCVAGRRLLTERLQKWRVDHHISGKLILAVEENDLDLLEKLLLRGQENGVEGLQLVDAGETKRREPHVSAVGALRSPASGVFDVADYIHSLAGHVQAAGALLINQAQVTAVDLQAHAITVHTEGKGRLSGRCLVNAAGLYADDIAAMCGDKRHTIYPCRGEYATVIPAKARLIKGLVYPVPGQISLGIHLTKTAAGELWVGPSARYIEHKENYEWGRLRPVDFHAAARRLFPALRASDLRMGPSGIRPKRVESDEPSADFHIDRQPDEPRVIHLIGIESPGLTAAPAIGRMVLDLARAIVS